MEPAETTMKDEDIIGYVTDEANVFFDAQARRCLAELIRRYRHALSSRPSEQQVHQNPPDRERDVGKDGEPDKSSEGGV